MTLNILKNNYQLIIFKGIELLFNSPKYLEIRTLDSLKTLQSLCICLYISIIQSIRELSKILRGSIRIDRILHRTHSNMVLRVREYHIIVLFVPASSSTVGQQTNRKSRIFIQQLSIVSQWVTQ